MLYTTTLNLNEDGTNEILVARTKIKQHNISIYPKNITFQNNYLIA